MGQSGSSATESDEYLPPSESQRVVAFTPDQHSRAATFEAPQTTTGRTNPVDNPFVIDYDRLPACPLRRLPGQDALELVELEYSLAPFTRRRGADLTIYVSRIPPAAMSNPPELPSEPSGAASWDLCGNATVPPSEAPAGGGDASGAGNLCVKIHPPKQVVESELPLLLCIHAQPRGPAVRRTGSTATSLANEKKKNKKTVAGAAGGVVGGVVGGPATSVAAAATDPSTEPREWMKWHFLYFSLLPSGQGYALDEWKETVSMNGTVWRVYKIFNACADEDKGESLCQVCRENQSDIMVLPCRHLCLCSQCAYILRVNDHLCPMCRGPIESLVVLNKPKKN